MTDPIRQRAEALAASLVVRAEDTGEVLAFTRPSELAAFIDKLAAFGRACAAEAVQWQPIETAPKDGTEVLLTDGKTYKRVGNWARRMECWSVDVLPPVKMPTHWMPLPTTYTPEAGR